MNFLVTLETLKIYKVKHERTIQVWFILLFALNIGLYYLPVGDKDFSPLLTSLNAMAAGETVLPVISTGNWITLGLTAFSSLLNLLFVFFYAALFVGEKADLDLRRIYGGCLKGLPCLLGFLLLMVVPMVFSAFLMFIPLFVFTAMMYLLPLFLMHDRAKLPVALENSFRFTRGLRLTIFVQIFFLSVLLSIPEGLILAIAPDSDLAILLVQSFFLVFQSFVQGRMMGIFYLFLVKKVPVMIPSKPTHPQA